MGLNVPILIKFTDWLQTYVYILQINCKWFLRLANQPSTLGKKNYYVGFFNLKICSTVKKLMSYDKLNIIIKNIIEYDLKVRPNKKLWFSVV